MKKNKNLLMYFLGLLSGVLLSVLILFYIAKIYVPNQMRDNLESPLQGGKKSNKSIDLNFKLVKLSDTLAPFEIKNTKKKVLFINFWESWCAPCVSELPSINNLYLDYKDKVEFVVISRGKESSNLTIASKYNLPFYSLKSKLPSAFNIQTIPQTYIIKDSKMILNQSSANWDDANFRKYLDSLTNN
jgi:thiol-disulfide isomerase/thioredoxin